MVNCWWSLTLFGKSNMSHVWHARVRYVVLVACATSHCLSVFTSCYRFGASCHVATSVALVAPTKSATVANFSLSLCVGGYVCVSPLAVDKVVRPVSPGAVFVWLCVLRLCSRIWHNICQTTKWQPQCYFHYAKGQQSRQRSFVVLVVAAAVSAAIAPKWYFTSFPGLP